MPRETSAAGKPAKNPLRSRIVGEGDENPEQLLANPANWRKHPKEQQEALEGLLRNVGWVQRVIVNRRTGHVVDGHARVELAIRRGEPSVPVLYVDLSEEEERLVLASLDPIGALAATDQQKLDELLQEVQAQDAGLQAFLDSLSEAGPGGEGDDQAQAQQYSKKVEAPVYTPKGERPAVSELCDQSRADALVAEISSEKSLPDDVRQFLQLAAMRHVVFDYHRIAEFYCHAEPRVQQLMEASALVIIDFDQAIERGYIELSKRIAEIYAATDGEAEDDED